MRIVQLTSLAVLAATLVACTEPPQDVAVQPTALSSQKKHAVAEPNPSTKGREPRAALPPYRGPRELTNRQFFPARGEGSTVGSLRAPVTRASRSFDKLVHCKNESIIFKDEERSGADRLMTQGTRERLVRLAALVEKEWPGLHLRVTEAWDEEHEHGARSVHYEGRAVDLTMSDKDRSKLGRLGGLAAEAGFEWVYYEHNHIHASTRRD